MIAQQVGYLKLNDVLKLKEDGTLFSIYKTHKNTNVLVLNRDKKNLNLTYPKKDRLPWKLTKGKKIVRCERIYCSKEDTEISTANWNNGEQIMCYEEYDCY